MQICRWKRKAVCESRMYLPRNILRCGKDETYRGVMDRANEGKRARDNTAGWGKTCRAERNFIGNPHQCCSCAPVSWRYSTWPVASFFSLFFTISGESSRQVTQMEERKSGRGPRKATRRVLAGYSQDFEFLRTPLLALRSCNDRFPAPGSTSTEDLVPHLRARGRMFLQRSRERLSPFSVSLLQLLSRNRESMGKHHERSGSKWLSDFYFLASLTLVPPRHCPSAVFDFSHKNARE